MKKIKRYSVRGRIDCDGDEIPPIIKENENGLYVKHSDHLAALEAARREAVVEWLKTRKEHCAEHLKGFYSERCFCCKYYVVCNREAQTLTDEDIQKAAEA